MIKIIFKIIIIFLIVLLHGCISQIPKEKNKESKIVYLLLDLSTSVKDKRSDFNDWALKIIEKMNGGDRLVVTLIMQKIYSFSDFIINEELYRFRPKHTVNLYREIERLEYEKKLKEKKEEWKVIIKKALTPPENKKDKIKTPIIESLTNSSDVFKEHNKYSKQYLIIFSDMVEESKDNNFRNQGQMNRKKIDQIIKNEKEKKKRLPNLKGINIIVSGARDRSSNYSSIKLFWECYFKACQAELKYYHPSLVGIDLELTGQNK